MTSDSSIFLSEELIETETYGADAIYDMLFAGETLTFLLPKGAFEGFKVSLFRVKKRKESQLVGLGVMEISELKALSIKGRPSEDDPNLVEVTLSLVPKVRAVKFVLLKRN